MMFALIMILLVTLFSMIMAYFIATKLKSNIMKSTVEKTSPTHLPTAYQTGRPNSIHWQFVDRHFVSQMCEKPTVVTKATNEFANKRDRRSLESFCWIPTEIQPVQGLQSVQSTAYYNKYGDFNSLYRSKQSIFLVWRLQYQMNSHVLIRGTVSVQRWILYL